MAAGTTPRKKPATGGRPSGWTRRRRWRYGLSVLAMLACGTAIVAAAAQQGLTRIERDIGQPPLSQVATTSKVVLDRDGRLLRAFTAEDGRWRLPVDAEDVDPRYLKLLFAFEDSRFETHGGVDYLAILRAGTQMIRHGRLVSGASTLTMQTARLIDRKHERTAMGKLRQMVRAWQLEDRLSKREILNLYLRLAPFGGNIEGVRAASLAYFGKEPKRLSLGQAALLVALPQSPEMRRPDRHADRARRARDHVLDRAVETGTISEAEASRAKAEAVPDRRLAFPMFAAHLAERAVAEAPEENVLRLTLSRGLQGALEEVGRGQARRIGKGLSTAILVADSDNGEILAHVGSSDYFDDARAGAIDMTQAVRSPGSTLKPFIYGLAFEDGIAHPATLIEDTRTRFGAYVPENFDEGFRGTVSVREALQASLNIPAVKMLDAIGPGRLLARLKNAGLTPELPAGAKPSLAVALGGLGLNLKDLLTAYAGLANGGEMLRLRHIMPRPAEGGGTQTRPALQGSDTPRGQGSDAEAPGPSRVLKPVAAWYVNDILKGAPAPEHFRGGRIAYKTGTSYGYRDAFAIGHDGRFVIAVWVGRPDAASVPGITGRTAAAPILFDAFQRLRAHVPAAKMRHRLSAPREAITGGVAQLPAPLRRFERHLREEMTGTFLEPKVAIAFPPDRSEVELSGGKNADQKARGPLDPVLIKAEGGVLPLTWLINGEPVESRAHERSVVWQPRAPGFANVSVIDAKGRVDRSSFRIR